MKKLLHTLIFILFTLKLIGQNNDTIQHITGDCIGGSCIDTTELFDFHFNNDTLIFSGNMFANSCGEHFLTYSINSNRIEINRLDTGELCKCHCLYAFEAKFPNCTLDSYQIELEEYFDNGLDTVIFRNSESNIDTISHITTPCSVESSVQYNFKFAGDTLIFDGVIEANCGGSHFLICSWDYDTIYITRLDTGQLEDCICLYEFEANLLNCPNDWYRVILDNEYSQGLDTIVYKTTSLIKSSLIINDIVYPNPASGLVNINLRNHFSGKVQIKIFDQLGKLVYAETEILEEANIEIDISFLQTGIYIMRINGEKKSISLKLMKE